MKSSFSNVWKTGDQFFIDGLAKIWFFFDQSKEIPKLLWKLWFKKYEAESQLGHNL